MLACAVPAFASGDLEQIDLLIDQAETLAKQGKAGEAESSMRSALDTAVTRLGSFHIAVAGINRRLASFLIDQHRYADAEHCLQKALVITSGYTPAAALNGEFRGITVFVNNALENPNRLPGSLEVADVLEGYARLYASTDRFSDAERMLKTATITYSNGVGQVAANYLFLSGDSTESYIRSMIALANVRANQSKVVEAEQTFETAISKMRSNPARLVPLLKAKARFYRLQGRSSEAESTESEAESAGR